MTYTEESYKPKMTLGQKGNYLFLLIAVCLIFFVGFAFMKAIWYFRFQKEIALSLYYTDIFNKFTLSADINHLGEKPWSLLTFMFIDDKVWAVLANMLWLTCFGSILQQRDGNRKIFPLFIYGSLGGGILFMIIYNLLPALSTQLPFAAVAGSSAGIMAIAAATTLIAPSHRFFPLIGGGIPLWIVFLVYAAASLLPSYNDIAALSLLTGGAITGALFAWFLRLGYDGSKWMNNLFDWFGNLFNPDKPAKGKSIKDELFYKSAGTPYTKTPNLTQERIDAVLDKINQQGYAALSEEEKELLRKASAE